MMKTIVPIIERFFMTDHLLLLSAFELPKSWK